MARVAVVGAGAVGLSTAVCIQNTLPSSKITIIADKFLEETTSYGAAGIFRPLYTKTPGVPLEVLTRWLRTSWDYLTALIHSPDATEAGVHLLSGYHLFNKTVPPDLFTAFSHGFRYLTEAELDMFPVRYKSGWFCTLLMCEGRLYLPFLMKKFKTKGGTIEKRHISSLEELVNDFDVVVNCAGYGNKTLVNDSQLVPIRGHLIRVTAPWLKHFVYTDEGCDIIPGRHQVVLGGTRQSGEDDLLIRRRDDYSAIWRKATTIVPSLQGASLETSHEWVGVRPFRIPLRLETEVMTFGTRSLPVVHNYGHGAEGISLSWGTGIEAAEHVKQILLQRTPVSKL